MMWGFASATPVYYMLDAAVQWTMIERRSRGLPRVRFLSLDSDFATMRGFAFPERLLDNE